MKVSLRGIGVGVTVVAVALLLGTFRPGSAPDGAEAALANFETWPSAAPGMPAFAPASGPGNLAVAHSTCSPDPSTGGCPRIPSDPSPTPGPLTYTLTQISGDGSVAARFDANDSTTLVCTEEGPCDLDLGPDFTAGSLDYDGNVAVQVNGGGENEVVNVEACDAEGDCRNALIAFVQTILAFRPEASGTGEDAPSFVSYACDVRSRVPTPTGFFQEGPSLDTDGFKDIEDVLSTLIPSFVAIGELPAGVALVLPEDYGVGWVCGNPGLTNSDEVTFETDRGTLSVAPFINPVTISGGCPTGDSITVLDYPHQPMGPGFPGFGPAPFGPPAGEQCDLDAFDAVVSYGLVATGDTGVATVTAQQLGGSGPLRTANVTFTGEAALSLFIDAPASVGASGADFTTTIVDQDGRPVDEETIECTVSPTDAALAIVPQAGTSDSLGNVTFLMVPTGAAIVGGEQLTINCVLDRDRDIAATATVSLSATPAAENPSTPPRMEALALLTGCNFVSWTGDDWVEPADLAAAVEAQADLLGIWAQQPPPQWVGYDPEFPQLSDMGPVAHLEAISICMAGLGSFTRPVIEVTELATFERPVV